LYPNEHFRTNSFSANYLKGSLMKSIIYISISALLFLFSLSESSASEPDSFIIELNNEISLSIPLNEGLSIEKSPGQFPMFEIKNSENDEFTLLVSFIQTRKNDIGKGIPGSIVKAAESMEESAVEEELEIIKYDEGTIPIHYFVATDKNSKPEDYKKLLSGQTAIKNVFISITLFFNDDDFDLEPLLLMLSKMSLVNLKAPKDATKLFLTIDDFEDNVVITDDLLVKSMQVKILYDSHEMYEQFCGKVIRKEHFAVESGGEKGSVIIMEYDGNNMDKAKSFLPSLLYGDGAKPSAAHPEEIKFVGNFLIIYCFEQDSILKEKVKSAVLKKLAE
jgi:hypothetical protein